MATSGFMGLPSLSGNLIDYFGAENSKRDAQQAYDRDKNLSDSRFNTNIAMQKEFAQSGIRWKVEDAARAGIHPLYAMGAQGAMASPVTVGEPQSPISPSGADVALGNMGQDISRAIHATRTNEERAFSILQLERAGLENQLLETQIYNLQHNQTGPPLPSAMDQPGNGLAGQGDAVNIVPQQNRASNPNAPEADAGAVSDYGLIRTSTGYSVAPSKDAKQLLEDMPIEEGFWAFRNHAKTAVSGPSNIDRLMKNFPLPKGAVKWHWNAFAHEIQPFYPGDDQAPWKGRSKNPRDRY